MAGVSVGNLTVSLGADDAPLQAGVARGKKALADFKKENEETLASIRRGALVISTAAVAAYTALTAAIQKSISEMATLGRAAEQIGTTAEKLSQLKFAAEQSGASFEDLNGALLTLAKGLDVAAGTGAGPAAQALQALGISATNASGELRASTDVLADAAAKFATYKDGAEKTALAVALFGDAGAKLIPLLNQGREGLAAMAAESDRLGATMSGDTTRAAETYSQTLNKVWAAIKNVVNLVTAELLPGMQQTADEFLRVSTNAENVRAAVAAIAGVMNAVGAVVAFVAQEFQVLSIQLSATVEAAKALANLDVQGALNAWADGARQAVAVLSEAAPAFQAWGQMAAQVNMAAVEIPKATAPIVSSVQTVAASMEALRTAAQATLAQLLEMPTETVEAKMAALDAAVRRGTIGWGEYLAAVKQVNAQATAQTASMANSITSILGSLFQDNKAAAIATALINTYQGITQALATLPPPASFAAAAAVAAAGFAQVRAITSTQPGTSGGAASVGSAGAAARDGDEKPNKSASAGAQQTLYVEGIDRASLFSGDAVRDIAQRLIEYQRDGGRVVLA